MAVRLASDTMRTLCAIQSVTKDVNHHSQYPFCKNISQKMCQEGGSRHMSGKLPADYEIPPAEKAKLDQKQQNSISNDSALVHKIHPTDRPLRNDVQERAKCTELDDILAKWNVHKPKK
ncbi:unnamed protein product [Xylocopa violacea]|uniref:Uncharacterized protein n=1 Tax=Xylocopa violacea TaxID=135666 RepID=A0ABP1NY47_XYLVO